MSSSYFTAAALIDRKCVLDMWADTVSSSKSSGCVPPTVFPNGLSHRTSFPTALTLRRELAFSVTYEQVYFAGSDELIHRNVWEEFLELLRRHMLVYVCDGAQSITNHLVGFESAFGGLYYDFYGISPCLHMDFHRTNSMDDECHFSTSEVQSARSLVGYLIGV